MKLSEETITALEVLYDPDELVDLLGITVAELARAFPEKVAAYLDEDDKEDDGNEQ